MFELVEQITLGAKIKVIGIGGGGGNGVNTMISAKLAGVDFIAANTDAQALEANRAPVKIQLGGNVTKGLGAGANPEIGRRSALEDQEKIKEYLSGSDMVFITAGMGGGTGTGGAPIIARIAREMGALTVAVVTKPFLFEGKKRMRQADDGIRELKEHVDALIAIPNQRLLSVASKTTTLMEAFQKADEVLLHAVRGISDLIVTPGLINLDFADVRAVMAEMGLAMMGASAASGENRAVEAAQKAISSPLLEDVSIHGARGILINITGGPDMSLCEVNEAAEIIHKEAHEEANIIFGAVLDERMKDEMRITVIATGFDDKDKEKEKEAARKPAQPVAVAVKERKVIHLGTIVDDLDSPTWQRKKPDSGEHENVTLDKAAHQFSPEDEDKFDIPTFLRRQMD
jgi:cell division protein FtsZ